MAHHPTGRSCAAAQSGRLVTAVIFDLVLVNRAAVCPSGQLQILRIALPGRA